MSAPTATTPVRIRRGPSSGWQLGGEQASPRSCRVGLQLLDPCAGGPLDVLSPGDPWVYSTAPVVATASLEQPTACAAPTDADWLTAQLTMAEGGLLELAVSTVLVTAPEPAGYGSARTWIGSPGVVQAAEIPAGRTAWLLANVGTGAPTLHVNPAQVPELLTGNILQTTASGDLLTCWGDPVITPAAYDAVAPLAFWAGGIAVTGGAVSALATVDVGRNRQIVTADWCS